MNLLNLDMAIVGPLEQNGVVRRGMVRSWWQKESLFGESTDNNDIIHGLQYWALNRKEDTAQEKPRRCYLLQISTALDPDVSFNLKARRCQDWLWPRTGGPGPPLAVSQCIGSSLRLGTSFVRLPNGRAHSVDVGLETEGLPGWVLSAAQCAQHFLI